VNTLDRIKKLVRHYGGNAGAVFLGADLHELFNGLDKQAGICTGLPKEEVMFNNHHPYTHTVGQRLQQHEVNMHSHARYMMAGKLADESDEMMIARKAREQERAAVVVFIRRIAGAKDYIADRIERGEHIRATI
jgi:hypothetical protein